MIPEHAGIRDGNGTGAQLLGRLENQQDLSGQVIFAAVEHRGCAQKCGGVYVVSAGVHDAAALGDDRICLVLCNGKRVDVSAQSNGRAGFAAVDHGQNAGFQRIVQHLNAVFMKKRADIFCGFVFLLT